MDGRLPKTTKFLSGQFQTQLKYYSDMLTNFSPFTFPVLGIDVSVQAGWGYHSSFLIAGKERRYPFLHEGDEDWDIGSLHKLESSSDDDEQYKDALHKSLRQRCKRQTRLFPPSQAVSYEVGLINVKGNRWPHFLHPKQLDLPIAGVDIENWPEGGPGNFVSSASVQTILDCLLEREQQAAAVTIQSVYKGWQCRKQHTWNPYTPFGHAQALKEYYELSKSLAPPRIG